MIALISPSKDVYFNLAAEEHFLKKFQEDVSFFYINDPAVVVGKHQNVMAESNYPFLMNSNIPLARRLSGGGTVFHDTGNINFSFIKNFTEQSRSVDFRSFLNPVIDFLKKNKVPAEYSERNDLLVEGKKFSGNAEHVHQQGKRTLHHGTILYNADLQNLGKAISKKGKVYTHKAVASVRSEVNNVSGYLEEDLSIEEFTKKLLDYFESKEGASLYTFTDKDFIEIEKLRVDKFSTWEWNIGYSPKYILETQYKVQEDCFSLKVNVQKGIIKDLVVRKNEVLLDLTSLIDKRLHWHDLKGFCTTLMETEEEGLALRENLF